MTKLDTHARRVVCAERNYFKAYWRFIHASHHEGSWDRLQLRQGKKRTGQGRWKTEHTHHTSEEVKQRKM